MRTSKRTIRPVARRGSKVVSSTTVMISGAILGLLGISLNLLFISSSNSDAAARSKVEVPVDEHISVPTAHEKNDTEVQYHLIFSTGCSIKQDWQSYVFFFHAMKSGQKGHVTRIASGCKPAEAEILTKMHEENIGFMSPNFHLHLTPEFSKVKKGTNFKYFNKPFGVLHWMEHALGFPDNTELEDTIIVLFDPDQVLLRPFSNDFSVEVWKSRTKASQNESSPLVRHGSPFAQAYGFGPQWKTKTNISAILPPSELPSHVDTMSKHEMMSHYNVGPPYLATGRDFYKIAKLWTELVVPVHDQYPYLLAEMFAYSLAAAHLDLPHQVAASFMVSDITASTASEGWKLLEEFSEQDLCRAVPTERMPHVLHYCHRYLLGKYIVGKHRLPKDFMSCDSPLLLEPPQNIGLLYDFAISPDKKSTTKYNNKNKRRTTFMLCTLIQAINEAAVFFKEAHCPHGANMNKSLVFHDSMDMEMM